MRCGNHMHALVYKYNFDHCRRIHREMYFGPLSPFSIVVADLTNGVVTDLTTVVAELDVADPTCRRLDRIPIISTCT